MAARRRRRCDDPKDVETWRAGIELAESRTFADFSGAVRSAVPLPVLLLRAMTVIRRRDIEAYRLNRYRGGDPDRRVTS